MPSLGLFCFAALSAIFAKIITTDAAEVEGALIKPHSAREPPQTGPGKRRTFAAINTEAFSYVGEIAGFTQAPLRHGLGLCVAHGSDFVHVGCWKNGVRHGIGTVIKLLSAPQNRLYYESYFYEGSFPVKYVATPSFLTHKIENEALGFSTELIAELRNTLVAYPVDICARGPECFAEELPHAALLKVMRSVQRIVKFLPEQSPNDAHPATVVSMTEIKEYTTEIARQTATVSRTASVVSRTTQQMTHIVTHTAQPTSCNSTFWPEFEPLDDILTLQTEAILCAESVVTPPAQLQSMRSECSSRDTPVFTCTFRSPFEGRVRLQLFSSTPHFYPRLCVYEECVKHRRKPLAQGVDVCLLVSSDTNYILQVFASDVPFDTVAKDSGAFFVWVNSIHCKSLFEFLCETMRRGVCGSHRYTLQASTQRLVRRAIDRGSCSISLRLLQSVAPLFACEAGECTATFAFLPERKVCGNFASVQNPMLVTIKEPNGTNFCPQSEEMTVRQSTPKSIHAFVNSVKITPIARAYNEMYF